MSSRRADYRWLKIAGFSVDFCSEACLYASCSFFIHIERICWRCLALKIFYSKSGSFYVIRTFLEDD